MAAFSSFQQHHPFSSSIFLPNSSTTPMNNKLCAQLLDQPNNSISQFNEQPSSSSSLFSATTINNNISMDSSSIVTDKYQHNPSPMPKKRKSKQPSSPNSVQSKDMRDQVIKGKNKKKVKESEEKNKLKEEDPKGYIHVRARRGQATDSHSLAERVRRERISERMKLLQSLVPGCDKVTGKALMLDEIINYVQSLQNQVEFLSLKLASVNPILYDFGVDLDPFMFRPDQNLSSLPSQLPAMQQSYSPTIGNPYPIMDINSANSLLFQQSQIPKKIKIEKEPMKLFMENGIEELAKLSLEEIEKSKLTKDDIDVRLKWLGLFHRRKHHYGRFMMRFKLPNGVTTSAQTRYLASVIRKYGEDGCADVTTRQNWQIRGVVLPDVPEILKGLEEVGLTSLQSGMDNVRNPVGNPLAGIDPHEIVDTRPYTNLLSQFITANSRGNPAFTNLPRKWNACVIGSHDLYEHPHINDLAYMPATKDGRFGFNLLVGGFFSTKRCAEAIPLDAWVPGDDILPVCKAILEAFRDLGARGNRQKARMMWLIDELGKEEFRAEVVQRMPQQHLERASSEDLVQSQWERRDYFGVHPQKQEGYSFVGIHIPVGRVQADDMDELARISDTYGSGELRLTVEQNIIIPNIENSKLEALLQEPLLKDRFSPEPPLLMKGLVACTGNQFCGQAIIETKARALKVTEEVNRLVSVTKPVRMHWTGCHNSCAQVQVADIGFMGCMTRNKDGKVVEGADVFLGGRIGSDSHLGDVYKKSVPCDDLVPLVVDLLVEKFGAVPREREEDED